MRFSERFAVHPEDFNSCDTEKIREEFLVNEVFVANEIILEYSLYDRYIVGGAMPVGQKLVLESFNSLKSDTFLVRRELEAYNARKINKLLVNSIVDTCQLQMGMAGENLDYGDMDTVQPTELK